jgi:hypothetical protein
MPSPSPFPKKVVVELGEATGRRPEKMMPDADLVQSLVWMSFRLACSQVVSS